MNWWLKSFILSCSLILSGCQTYNPSSELVVPQLIAALPPSDNQPVFIGKGAWMPQQRGAYEYRHMGWADNYPAYKEGGLVITDSNIYFAEYDHSGAKYFMSKKLELNAIQETILDNYGLNRFFGVQGEDLEWNTFQFIKTAVVDTEKTEQAYNFVRLILEQNKKN